MLLLKAMDSASERNGKICKAGQMSLWDMANVFRENMLEK